MKRTKKVLFLLALGSTLMFSGCRRAAVETESESETQTETASETETEKTTEKSTEKETEKTTKKTSSSSKKSSKTSVSPSKSGSSSSSSSSSTTSDSGTKQCPYCYGTFSTATDANGDSEYSTHYAQEKAYADLYGIEPSGTSDSTTSETDSSTSSSGTDTGYSQCPYCFQWFSTASDSSGYSPYGEHLASEEAYAAQNADETYQQCSYCGLWLDADTYADHMANGY